MLTIQSIYIIFDLFSLMEALSAVDLLSSTVHIYLKEAVKIVIEDYMEPKGFAADILLDQFNLLQHLNALYTVVQLTSALSAILITEVLLSISNSPKYLYWPFSWVVWQFNLMWLSILFLRKPLILTCRSRKGNFNNMLLKLWWISLQTRFDHHKIYSNWNWELPGKLLKIGIFYT